MLDIVIKNFVKKYGELTAVNNISMQVNPGELYGLIGPDGAGKTTLMRAICTLLVPDSGEIFVKGIDVTKNIAKIRSMLGYMPQRFSLYQDLSVEQNLRFFADLFQVAPQERNERLKQLYKFSRLEPFKKRAAGALSGGMKQKLALSCALIHTPQVLILDEPTFGVDPVSRKEFWDILRSIRNEGTTILVSTAYMDEADQCDRVSLIFDGQIKATNTPEKLKTNYRYPLFMLKGKDLRTLRRFFVNQKNVYSTQMFGDVIHVSFYSQPQEREWQNWQKETEENLQEWAIHSPTIEDVFLELMRR